MAIRVVTDPTAVEAPAVRSVTTRMAIELALLSSARIERRGQEIGGENREIGRAHV